MLMIYASASPSRSPKHSLFSSSAYGSSRALSTTRGRQSSSGQNGDYMDEDAPPTDSLVESENDAIPASSTPVYMSSPPPSSSMKRRELPGMDSSPLPATATASSQSNPAATASDPKQIYKLTLFGFPPSMQSSIISHFASISPIVYNSTGSSGAGEAASPTGSNWVTIGYDNEWSALRALRRNGDVLGGNCMIGVKWAEGGSSSSAPLSSAAAAENATAQPSQAQALVPRPAAATSSSGSSLGQPAIVLPSSQAWLAHKPSSMMTRNNVVSAASGRLGELGKMDPAMFKQEEEQKTGGGWTGSLTNLIFGF